MSAAHHLLTRGEDRFDVEIFERRTMGGKARSAVKDYTDLPTEHGFRFFPGFYKHITATMKEIPLDTGGNVYDKNLVDTDVYTFLFSNKSGRLDVPINVGTYLSSFRFGTLVNKIRRLRKQKQDSGIEITEDGTKRFVQSITEVFTTCNARIDNNYDNISWSEYIDAENRANVYGADYKDLLATGISKNLVAVRADVANARTGAKLIGHMIWHIVSPFAPPADKILNAPTQDAWIDPWVNFLRQKGLTIHTDRRVVSIEFDPGTRLITGVRHDDVEAIYNQEDPVVKGKSWKYYESSDVIAKLKLEQADYFICAMPIERLDEVMERSKFNGYQIKQYDPALQNFEALWRNTEWMTGIMFYFDTPIDIARGHITIADEDAAVTMISQLQFWTEYLRNRQPIVRKGKTVKALLSVIVSNWEAKSKYIANKDIRLRNLSREEVVEEIRELIFRCEIEKGKTLGTYRDNLIDAFLDDSITDYDPNLANPRYKEIEGKFTLYNKEPLFINKTHSYHLRPTGYTAFRNLFLASDYVKTNADLGCMDSADEAARRAVNNILRLEKLRDFCQISLYRLPSFFGLLDTARILDYRSFKMGLKYRRNVILKMLTWYTKTVLAIVRAQMPEWLKVPILLGLVITLLPIFILNMLAFMALKMIYVTGV